MAQRRQEIETFVRRIVVKIEAVEGAGTTAAQAIAGQFNAKGVTTLRTVASDF